MLFGRKKANPIKSQNYNYKCLLDVHTHLDTYANWCVCPDEQSWDKLCSVSRDQISSAHLLRPEQVRKYQRRFVDKQFCPTVIDFLTS